ncbi:hypothetical protein V6N13_141052 [Hibiscus sabdariffa]|uniref:F-box domain-containing protein n=1 Tax=Hibiscus sabdariffa TaxID=183260 RepID=A0ABR2Q166_9ROSI
MELPLMEQYMEELELDRISALPDCTLHHILGFLPTTDAVRTCILSPRWRYLFASMPRLDIQLHLPDIIFRRSNESFKNFMGRLLFFGSRNVAPLESFRLYDVLMWDDDCWRPYGWLYVVLWRGVRDLDIGL